MSLSLCFWNMSRGCLSNYVAFPSLSTEAFLLPTFLYDILWQSLKYWGRSPYGLKLLPSRSSVKSLISAMGTALQVAIIDSVANDVQTQELGAERHKQQAVGAEWRWWPASNRYKGRTKGVHVESVLRLRAQPPASHSRSPLLPAIHCKDVVRKDSHRHWPSLYKYT